MNVMTRAELAEPLGQAITACADKAAACADKDDPASALAYAEAAEKLAHALDLMRGTPAPGN